MGTLWVITIIAFVLSIYATVKVSQDSSSDGVTRAVGYTTTTTNTLTTDDGMNVGVTFDSAYFPFFPIMGKRIRDPQSRTYLRDYLSNRLGEIATLVRVGGTTQDFQYYSNTTTSSNWNGSLVTDVGDTLFFKNYHCNLDHSSCTEEDTTNNVIHYHCPLGKMLVMKYNEEYSDTCDMTYALDSNDKYSLKLDFKFNPDSASPTYQNKTFYCPFRWVKREGSQIKFQCQSGYPQTLEPFDRQLNCYNLPQEAEWNLSNSRCKDLFATSDIEDISEYPFFKGLDNFMELSNATYIFGVNAFYNQSHPELPAQTLVDQKIDLSNFYSILDKVTLPNMHGVSIGNEVNQYFLGKTQADALLNFSEKRPEKKLYGPDGHSQAAGPNSATNESFVTDFVTNASNDTIFTFHSYSLNNSITGNFKYGENCSNMLNFTWLTNFRRQNANLLGWVENGKPGMTIVGSEIGPNNKGGNVTCNTGFANSFWYTTMLGQAASMNISVIYRQTFFSKAKEDIIEGTHITAGYPLLLACGAWSGDNCQVATNWTTWYGNLPDNLSDTDLTRSNIAPCPDFYITFLWKKLMHSKQINYTETAEYISYKHAEWTVYVNHNTNQSVIIQ